MNYGSDSSMRKNRGKTWREFNPQWHEKKYLSLWVWGLPGENEKNILSSDRVPDLQKVTLKFGAYFSNCSSHWLWICWFLTTILSRVPSARTGSCTSRKLTKYFSHVLNCWRAGYKRSALWLMASSPFCDNATSNHQMCAVLIGDGQKELTLDCTQAWSLYCW